VEGRRRAGAPESLLADGGGPEGADANSWLPLPELGRRERRRVGAGWEQEKEEWGK
jgi:hypothetical protein